jgi:nitroreductase
MTARPATVMHRDIDHVLTTTRTVRRRMDLGRPVPRGLIEECLNLALQAPSGANRQDWRFVVADDAAVRQSVADLYQRAFAAHYGEDKAPTAAGRRLPSGVALSARYLARNLGAVPAIVVPYRQAPAPDQRSQQASFWASVLPATWSFMLAARSRGLVTAYTARGLDCEEEIAAVLGIPYPAATQAGLVAVGYPDGQEFRPAPRTALADVLDWNRRG